MRLMPALALGFLATVSSTAMVTNVAVAKEKKEEAPGLKPSPEFVKVYQQIDMLSKAKDFAGAKAQLPAAEQAAKNADDMFLLGNITLNVGLGAQDETLQRSGLEKMLASGKPNPADAAKFNYFIGQFALKAKQYDDAIKHFDAAAAGGYSVSGAQLAIAESYFAKASMSVVGDQLSPTGKQIAQQGLGYLKKAIDSEKAAGGQVPVNWYDRGFTMAALSSSPDLPMWTDITLKADPKPENWRIALRTYQDAHKMMTREENLDVLRLMAVTGGLKDAYSYGEYVEATMKSGLVGEAKAVIEQGRAAGNITSTQLSDYYSQASTAAAKDRASLASAETDAAKAANGRIAASTGDAFLGYGVYDKAAAMYRLALQKGGVNADEVNAHLGIALAKGGDLTGAKDAFSKVAGSPVRKEITGYWLTWLASKGA